MLSEAGGGEIFPAKSCRAPEKSLYAPARFEKLINCYHQLPANIG